MSMNVTVRLKMAMTIFTLPTLVLTSAVRADGGASGKGGGTIAASEVSGVVGSIVTALEQLNGSSNPHIIKLKDIQAHYRVVVLYPPERPKLPIPPYGDRDAVSDPDKLILTIASDAKFSIPLLVHELCVLSRLERSDQYRVSRPLYEGLLAAGYGEERLKSTPNSYLQSWEKVADKMLKVVSYSNNTSRRMLCKARIKILEDAHQISMRTFPAGACTTSSISYYSCDSSWTKCQIDVSDSESIEFLTLSVDDGTIFYVDAGHARDCSKYNRCSSSSEINYEVDNGSN